jgi:hypothetical protein
MTMRHAASAKLAIMLSDVRFIMRVTVLDFWMTMGEQGPD